MNLFKNQTNKQNSYLKIIDRLITMKIGDAEQLEDIRLDLEEGIILSKEKRNYLKELITQLRKQVTTTHTSNSDISMQKQHNIEQTTKIKKENETNIKRKRSFSFFGKKKRKIQDKKDTKLVDKKNIQEHIEEIKIKKSKRKISFSLFGRKKPGKEKSIKKNNQKDDSFESKLHEPKVMDTSTIQENDEKNIPVHSKKQSTLQIMDSKDTKSEINDDISESLNGEKEFEMIIESQNTKFQSCKEVELEEIRRLIDDAKTKKNELSDDIDKVKSNYTYEKFVARYEQIQESLDSASSGLYSIQSVVYQRIKEIRKLKEELASMRIDIDGLYQRPKKETNHNSSLLD